MSPLARKQVLDTLAGLPLADPRLARAAAAKLAWERTLAFFKKHLD